VLGIDQDKDPKDAADYPHRKHFPGPTITLKKRDSIRLI